MTLLWFWILRNFSSAKEIVGCSWLHWQISAKGFDFHEEFTNFLKLFAKKDEPLLSCSLLLFRHDIPILLLSIKVKPLDVYIRCPYGEVNYYLFKINNEDPRTFVCVWIFFLSVRVFFHRHGQFTGQQGKGRDHHYSSLSLPLTYEHSDNFFPTLQLRWLPVKYFWLHCLQPQDFYSMRFTPLEKHHLIHCEQSVNFCLLDNSRFCYSNLTRGSTGFELVLTITVVLRANRLTKCASHPILFV